MADVSDVLDVLYTSSIQAVYPNGVGQPSVTGKQITIEKGWPIRSQLDDDLLAGFSHVSIFPTNMEKNVTKFERVFHDSQAGLQTIFPIVSGQTVAINGTITLPQAVMILTDGIGYGYQVQSTDTLTTIATALAALIPGATSLNNVVTVPDTVDELIARVAINFSAVEEIKRQERVFMVTIWSPTPDDRTTIGEALDVYLGNLYRVAMPDNVFSMWWYVQSIEDDDLEKSIIYKRTLMYKIQYATTITEDYTTITDPFVNSLTVNQTG